MRMTFLQFILIIIAHLYHYVNNSFNILLILKQVNQYYSKQAIGAYILTLYLSPAFCTYLLDTMCKLCYNCSIDKHIVVCISDVIICCCTELKEGVEFE